MGLVELLAPWAPGDLRVSGEMWDRKGIPVKSVFRVFREIRDQSDPKVIKAL